jgi:signal transduction histidine kinase
MDRERPGRDADPLALQPALNDLCRVLLSLRDRLNPPGRVSVAGRDPGQHRAEADARTLGIVQELLTAPLVDHDPFALTVDRASRWLAADRAMLFVAEPDGTSLVPRAAHGFRKEDLGSISVRAGEGIIGRAFEERWALVHPESGGGPPDSFIERFPVCEAAAVPVRGEHDVAGVLYVGRRQPDAPFTPGDILLLLAIADRAGTALARQAAHDRRARQIARVMELGRLAGQLLAARSVGEVLGAACEAGRRVADVPAVAIAVEVGPAELEVVAACGLPAAAGGRGRISTRDGVTADLYRGEDIVACRDVQARRPSEQSFLGISGFRGCLLVALSVEDAPAPGVLYLADPDVRDFSTEEIEAARVLARIAAAAISAGCAEGAARPGSVSPGNDRTTQIEKARALGEMATGLARELNTIFAIILGKSRLLLARANSEPIREGLAATEEAAWRGADIVHRMMALAVPASDAPTGPVDLVALVRDVIAVTQSRWRDAPEGPGGSIDVIADLESVRPVRGSEPALREMLMNLILNAVDAMAGGGRLTLSTRPRDDGVELAIEDTGEGILEEVRGRVFDAFFTTRAPARMGLGLTVAQGVVVRHGGSIELASGAQGGTRVTVWLPEARSMAGPAGRSMPALL